MVARLLQLLCTSSHQGSQTPLVHSAIHEQHICDGEREERTFKISLSIARRDVGRTRCFGQLAGEQSGASIDQHGELENSWRFDKLDDEHLKMWSKRSFEKFEGNNLAPPGMPSLPSEANEEKEGEAVKRARLEGSKNVRPSCHCA